MGVVQGTRHLFVEDFFSTAAHDTCRMALFEGVVWQDPRSPLHNLEAGFATLSCLTARLFEKESK